METLVLRLSPGEDLREVLRQVLVVRSERAACVVSAVGSFTRAVLRYAGAEQGTVLEGPLELVTLSGTLGVDGPHLHAIVSDAVGDVRGGHVMAGCIVRTTAEIVLGCCRSGSSGGSRMLGRGVRNWWRRGWCSGARAIRCRARSSLSVRRSSSTPPPS